MSSSPIEAQPPATLAVQPARLVKRALPRGMFGRALLIVIIPLILLQAIATWFFYDRHWKAVTWRLSGGVVGEIALTIEAARLAPRPEPVLRGAEPLADLGFALHRGARLGAAVAAHDESVLEEQLRDIIEQRIARPYRIDMDSDSDAILIDIQLSDGVLAVTVPRKLLSSPTTYIFVMWMVGSSVVLLAIASVFLRNQVKSLRRLAAAADSFGKGRPVPPFKVEGATEVRRAAIAFTTMRDRIERQIRQRTEMLAGVSHDLRTPLTRMKLALELLAPDPAVEELKSDVAEMEHMVQGYLDFVRGEGAEAPVETDVALLLEDLVAAARRDGTPLSFAGPSEYLMPLRPNALRRCLDNLIGNARRYGSHVWLTGIAVADGIDIIVDDDGPGIAAADRERAFRPFVRLDAARSPATGGVGLGLTIARDVARSHGGDIRLETSPQGGLRARLHLPR